jgi:predicted transcriptional regulator
MEAMKGFSVLGNVVSVKTERYAETITLRRVKVERLTASTLKSFIDMTGTKEANVVQIGEFLAYGYTGKNNTVFLCLKDGLIYVQEDNHNNRREAIIFLQKLNKFDLVEGFKRKQWHRNFGSVKGWVN